MRRQARQLVAKLEDYFRRVETENMADVPILNPSLRVQAVGFHATESGWLGILITPWFINLVLLPRHTEAWQQLKVGSSCRHQFASGSYEFLVANAEDVGRYQSCSLLSPVLELTDQQAAVAVAYAALECLHRPERNDLESRTRAAEFERPWHAKDDEQSGVAGREEPCDTTTKRKTQISRRDLLCGGFRDRWTTRE